MYKKLFSFFLLTLFLVSFASAEIYRQYEPIDLHVSVDQNGSVSGVTTNITVRYPNNSISVAGESMDNIFGTTDWKYRLNHTSVAGTYSYTVCAYHAVENKCYGYNFDVTPSGVTQTSILDNPMILILGVLALFFLLVGIYTENSIFGFIGSIMFILGGVYTMIYGFNNEQTLYTQGIALVILCTGFIFMFISAFEWMGWGEGSNDGGDDDD